MMIYFTLKKYTIIYAKKIIIIFGRMVQKEPSNANDCLVVFNTILYFVENSEWHSTKYIYIIS